MKLTIAEVEVRMTKAWKRQALVVAYRISGNRHVHTVTDHTQNWLPLVESWVGGQQVFEPMDGQWPSSNSEPWAEAVAAATERARAYFTKEGNQAALTRLPRAVLIAEEQNWTKLGDEYDTWLIPSSNGEKVYRVNGRCTCPDTVPGGWCKHRLARALAKSAAKGHENSKDKSQPRQIELVVAYAADEARSLARVGEGQLVRFEADGQETPAPTGNLSQLYRWLQENGYVPSGFKWLGWERGLRQRRQTYVLADERDTALPVQHSRGRSKLFKEVS